jgi:hypothetical protein
VIGPERYLHGSIVIVPVRVAAWLDHAADLRALRGRARGDDPERDAVLSAIRLAALQHRERSARATATVTAPQLVAGSASWQSASDIAARLGVTPAAVRKACRQGRYRAVKRDDRWLVDPDSI